MAAQPLDLCGRTAHCSVRRALQATHFERHPHLPREAVCCLWDIQKVLFVSLRCKGLYGDMQTLNTENLVAFLREY